MKTRVIQDEPEPTEPGMPGDVAAGQRRRPTNLPGGNPAPGADEDVGEVPVADDPHALEPDPNGGK